ncbi:MAG: molybdopterin-dependent oxidoreductase [Acidobacteria bacterium]|nr:molybdopterin-dependent oxidoreductase [Acidobacteriota bacterium]
MSERERNKLEETSGTLPAAGDAGGRITSHIVETDAEHAATVAGDAERAATAAGDAAARQEMSRRSRRSFLALGIAAAGGGVGWRWLQSSADADGIHAPLRAAHEFNARLSSAYFSNARLAPTFARELAREPRVNGREGLPEDFDPAVWRLQVIGLANASSYPQYREDVAYETTNGDDEATHDSSVQGGDAGVGQASQEAKGGAGEGGGSAAPAEGFEEYQEPGLLLTLDDIRALPRVEMTTELKCIEGWSTIVNWAGARFADFAARYQPPTREGGRAPDVRERPEELVRYVGMETPDGGYYVGMDMPSALHPQTLLCYEMNGQPLTPEHGAPLRLVTPVKYGIKHIKRIGRITFTDERPGDFWAERGYDWYSGH